MVLSQPMNQHKQDLTKRVLLTYLVSRRRRLRPSPDITLNITKPAGVIFAHPRQYTLQERLCQLVQKVSHGIAFVGKPWAVPLYRYPIQTLLAVLVFWGGWWGFYQLSEQIFRDLPSPSQLRESSPSVSSRIMDRDGNTLYRIYEDENRTLVPLSEISPMAINATIAIEDRDFWYHHGFSLRGMLRALSSNIQQDSVQGGSTLTQQLVKNRLLSPERTVERKIKELILAIMTEVEFSKEEILEMYMNQVAFGGSTYGIEEAAQRYFGKSAKQLTLAESALLAGLPAAPSAYSPFGPSPQRAFQRQQEVLRRLVEDGYITTTQAEQAALEQLAFRLDTVDIQAPHFVMFVKSLLAQEYGEDLLAHGGLEIVTTLDSALQATAQTIVTDEVADLARLKVSNGAALVTNPQTGEILAMVGSKNYFNIAQDGQVNITLRERQPGSSIKPLTYALAFERGLTPASKVLDAPITYLIQGSPPYAPRNYDGKFHGLVSVREALASSYNVPAVKTLAHLGVNNFIDFAEKMGITTWKDRTRFGLSLTLGGGEVRMIDLARAYGTFATLGRSIPLNPIVQVTDMHGNVLYYNHCAFNSQLCTGSQIISPAVAYQITHVLKDNQARTPAFGSMSTLTIPGQEVAVKTGTTNNLRDNWTFGYTSDRLVATWVGNNDNTPMSYVASGITGASQIWNKIMRQLLSEERPHTFTQPSTIVTLPACNSGAQPCVVCANGSEEVYIRGNEPKNPCAAQWVTWYRDITATGAAVRVN